MFTPSFKPTHNFITDYTWAHFSIVDLVNTFLSVQVHKDNYYRFNITEKDIAAHKAIFNLHSMLQDNLQNANEDLFLCLNFKKAFDKALILVLLFYKKWLIFKTFLKYYIHFVQ